MKKYIYLCFSIFFLLILQSCDIKNNIAAIKPEESFQKVYDNQRFSLAFSPLNVIQLTDGGYIVYSKINIAESNFGGIYLQKIDKLGNFVKSSNLETNNVAPLPNLLVSGNRMYIFAMDNTTLEAKLIEIDQELNVVNNATVTGTTYPLACALKSNGNFLLQYYNREDKQTVSAEVNTAGQITNSQSYSVGTDPYDPEPRILGHLIGTEKPLPFAIGETNGGKIYFNGFINFAFSTCFFNFGNSGIPAIIQGFNDQRGIGSLVSLNGTEFALSHFNPNGIYILPKSQLNTSGISTTESLKGYPIIEFSTDSKIVSRKLIMASRSVVYFAGNTPNNYLSIYLYDATTGAFIKAENIGYGNKHEIADITATTDGGLAVAGTTYLNGKLPRIFINKYSKSQIEAWIK